MREFINILNESKSKKQLNEGTMNNYGIFSKNREKRMAAIQMLLKAREKGLRCDKAIAFFDNNKIVFDDELFDMIERLAKTHGRHDVFLSTAVDKLLRDLVMSSIWPE